MAMVNVVWDTKGGKGPVPPTQVGVPPGISGLDVADWLSDRYGWCVEGWSWAESEEEAETRIKVEVDRARGTGTDIAVLVVEFSEEEGLTGEDVAELLRERFEEEGVSAAVAVAWTSN